MALRTEYIGDTDWTKFTEADKTFFHGHLGTVMYICKIAVLCEDSVEELIWRANLCKLYSGKEWGEEHVEFMSKFFPTIINDTTQGRLEWMRNHFRPEIAKYNKAWTKNVDAQGYNFQYEYNK